MTGNAGERLFQAMEQIPDEIILEAAQEQLNLDAGADEEKLNIGNTDEDEITDEIIKERINKNTGKNANKSTEENTIADTEKNADKAAKKRIVENTDKAVNTGDNEDKDSNKRTNKNPILNIGCYIKYLPVVACLCIVLGGAGVILNNFLIQDSAKDMAASGSMDGGTSQNENPDENGMDISMDEGMKEDSDEIADGAALPDNGTEGAPENEYGAQEDGGGDWKRQLQPVRYDVYEGPVFPLTATGDTQNLNVSRSLKGAVVAEEDGNGRWPLLQVTDDYQLKNTSKDDQTLQIVYPFVSALNRAYEMDGPILQADGEEELSVVFSAGESICAYRNADVSDTSSLEDYEQIFNAKTDYQEQALAKEADWQKEVVVYTFSGFQMQEGSDERNQTGVMGVSVKGAEADVLTYGFDHSFVKEDGSTNYCFFIPQQPEKLVLIVTGELEDEPEAAFYTNLDCEEKTEGTGYEMSRQEMSYADALRICSFDAARSLRQKYEQGLFAAELPEYMNEDAAFQVLTMVDEEESFYETLLRRYQSTELTEIFEHLFGETRVIYARATVTVPAEQSLQVTVRTQKRQTQKSSVYLENAEASYDFLSDAQSHLQIKKSSVTIKLAKEWELKDQNLGLKQVRRRVWKAKLRKRAGNFTIGRKLGQ